MSIYWLDANRWKDFSLDNLESWVPTYGMWCGPGWGGGKRLLDNEQPDWGIRADGPVDTACKTHDWAYSNAQGQSNEQELKLIADLQLLQDIKSMTFFTMSSTEQGYAIDMATAFMIKLVAYDTFAAFGESLVNIKNQAIEYFSGLLNNFTDVTFMPGNSGDYLTDKITDIYRDFFTTAKTTISPIVLDLDLDGDGVETTGVTAGAYFDHDGNGFAEQTGWAGADDGILVRDINENGTIDTGKELFGNETLLNNGSNAANGFQALSELDSNIDGKVDVNDSSFSSLKIWQDTDGDGYSTADELVSLSDAGVASINTGTLLPQQ